MSRTRDHQRVAAVRLALQASQGSTKHELATATGIDITSVEGVLLYLNEERDEVFERLGRWFAGRKKAPMPNEINHREQADRVAERVNGWVVGTAPVMRAIAADALLSGRLSAALTEGMQVPDLSTVPLHRRPAAIEEALVAHEVATSGGPCDACGTTKRRWGRGPFDWSFDFNAEPPQFFHDTKRKITVCQWCRDTINELGSVSRLQRKIFAAAAGLVTTSNTHRVKLARDSKRRGDGTPWSHVPQDECMKIAVRHYHKRQFATTLAQAQNSSVLGLEPVLWQAEDLPKAPVKYLPPSKLDLARAAQDREAERQFQATKDREAERKAAWLRVLAARDEKREQMTEEESAAYEAELRRLDSPVRGRR